MKNANRIAVVLALGLSLAFVGVGWIFSTILLYPAKFPCSLPREKLLYVYCGTPRELGVPFEDVSFKTTDGLTLRAWYSPARNAHRVVIVAHGRHAGKWTALRYMPALYRAGLNVLAFDFRNHGNSEGSVTTTGYLEKRDVRAAVNYAFQRGNRSVGVYGFSMGAATSILAMADDPRIQAGIFESSFADFGDLIAETARADYFVPRFPMVPFVLGLFEMRSGARVAEIRPQSVVASIAPRPVFFIHGSADPVIRMSHSLRLVENAREPKQFWAVAGGKHVDSWNVNAKRAELLVTHFFTRNLR